MDESLLHMCVDLQNSRDVALLRWLIDQAGAERVRWVSCSLVTRHRPRPQRIARELGLAPPESLREAPAPARHWGGRPTSRRDHEPDRAVRRL